ncbi:MAG: type B 50S ribosomal protein L31 [Candidatus Latescibacteria bacterium]|nr:type B 50S ribosomal protein L31 [Candidatus Latescibacterota bacterium]
MKAETHPDYQQVIFLDVSCGYKILTRSTLVSEETMEWEDGNSYPVIRTEISSESHPFYTGKQQRVMDRGGRIEQFNRRYKKEQTESTDEA